MISVILPSRGRPESLFRAVSSLARGDVEIIVGLDEDDPTANEAERLIAHLPGVGIVKGIRKITTGQLFNDLAAHAVGDWFIPFPDDYVVDEPDWAARLVPVLGALPNTLGVGYLSDPMYPHFATFPIVSRETIKLAGFFMPPFFPFLFGDTWWNEVGVMSGMILPANAGVSIMGEHGHTHKYKDLPLWSDLFQKTRVMREAMAVEMIRRAFGPDSENGAYLITTLHERSTLCADLQESQRSPEFYEKWDDTGFVHPDYAAVRDRAVAFMGATG